jgi:hypothetical protein
MKPRRIVTASGIIATLLRPDAFVWAQAVPPPAPTTPAAPAASGGSAALTAAIVVVAMLLLVAVVVKLFDLKRKRESEAVHLQAQISDALLRDQALFGLPITPTAQVPLWRGSPATIEVAGQVPTAELREAVLRIASSEAARIRPDFKIVDRLAVVPSMARAA